MTLSVLWIFKETSIIKPIGLSFREKNKCANVKALETEQTYITNSLPKAKQQHNIVCTYCISTILYTFSYGTNVQVCFTLDNIVNLYMHTRWLFNGTHHWFMLNRDAIWKCHHRGRSHRHRHRHRSYCCSYRRSQMDMGGFKITLKMFNTVKVFTMMIHSNNTDLLDGAPCIVEFQHIFHCICETAFVCIMAYMFIIQVFQTQFITLIVYKSDKCFAIVKCTKRNEKSIHWKLMAASVLYCLNLYC